jgi:hypothetical protein
MDPRNVVYLCASLCTRSDTRELVPRIPCGKGDSTSSCGEEKSVLKLLF